MPRPLVWVGVAYTLGAAWAAGGQNIFYGIAGIAFCMWITGRIRQSWTGMWLFWFLPVFFVSGFVIFSHSMQEIRDDTSEYQLLIRLLKERTIIDDGGSRRLRQKRVS